MAWIVYTTTGLKLMFSNCNPQQRTKLQQSEPQIFMLKSFQHPKNVHQAMFPSL